MTNVAKKTLQIIYYKIKNVLSLYSMGDYVHSLYRIPYFSCVPICCFHNEQFYWHF